MGRMGLINSGGASGRMILRKPVARPSSTSARVALGLISGRKAFQRPMKEGVKLLNTIQDVYLCPEVTVA